MKITENVYMLESSKHSHVFLIKAEENILIDTGLPGNARQILKELQSIGVDYGSIQKILLTHHDIDHIGNVKRLQEATGAEVWAHEKDIPYIIGIENPLGIKRIIQTIVRLPKLNVLRAFVADQKFDELSVIHAPGHTPGHSIFQYRNILFTGDLFEIKNGKLELLPKFMNWNQEELKKSVSLIKNIDFEWLCPSHGYPIQNGIEVKDFLKSF